MRLRSLFLPTPMILSTLLISASVSTAARAISVSLDEQIYCAYDKFICARERPKSEQKQSLEYHGVSQVR